jgi:hypothetical protein
MPKRWLGIPVYVDFPEAHCIAQLVEKLTLQRTRRLDLDDTSRMHIFNNPTHKIPISTYLTSRELLVWNNGGKRIESFYKIRKHVKRSGHFLGTALDSHVDPSERFMFYHIILLDETVFIRESYDRWRELRL